MNKPEGIFTPYLDLDEHLLWMVERKQQDKHIEKRLQLFVNLAIVGLGMFLGGFIFGSGGVADYIFQFLGALFFVFIAIEYRYQLLMPSTVWYGLTTKHVLIKYPSRLKHVSLIETDKIIGYRENDGNYAVAFRGSHGRLIVSNLLLHQIRRLIPLLREYTSIEIEMPQLPASPPSS